MTKEVPSWLFVSKSLEFYVVKLSSYSKLITHMFVISLGRSLLIPCSSSD